MPDDHLDDERLSAAIDGADAGAAAHLATCPHCSALADRLRRASALVATPVEALPARTVDRLVAGALDAPAPVVAMPRARRRPPAQWLVAVAALAAVVVGVPALLRSAGSGDQVGTAVSTGADQRYDATADRESAQSVEDETVIASPAAGGAGGASGSDGYDGDLGDIGDEKTLTSSLESRLSTGPPGASALRSSEGGADAAPRCTEEARAVGAGRLGSLVYRATLRWRGESSEVLVFTLTEPAGETRQAYVLSVPACDVLAEPRF